MLLQTHTVKALVISISKSLSLLHFKRYFTFTAGRGMKYIGAIDQVFFTLLTEANVSREPLRPGLSFSMITESLLRLIRRNSLKFNNIQGPPL